MRKFFFLILFLGTTQALVYDPNRFIPSYGKTVTMSSTEGDHVGSFAVDGDYNNHIGNDLKYSLTTVSTDPYLQVDIGYTVRAQQINYLIPFAGRDPDHLTTITIGNDPTVGSTANLQVFSKKLGSIWSYVKLSALGRYVTVQKIGVDVTLYVTELAVHILPVEDIAYLKDVVAENSLAGYEESKITSYYTYVFTVVDGERWLRIDLVYSYFIRELYIAGRQDCCSWTRGHHFHVRIGNSLKNNGNSNAICLSNEDVFTSEIRMFACNLFGKFINVFKDKSHSASLSLGEIYVNPELTVNVANTAEAFTNTAHTGDREVDRVIDGKGRVYSSVNDGADKRVWLVLNQTYNIAKVQIMAIDDHASPLSMDVSVGTTDDYSQSVTCTRADIAQELDHIRSFFCEPRIAGQYVFVQRNEFSKSLKVTEIGVYEETAPMIIDFPTTSQWQGLQQGSDVTLNCQAKGFPVPTITWVKDNEILMNSSTTLQLTNVQQNQSGRYECWASNIHGADAKPIYLTFYDELMACAKFVELDYYPSKTQFLMGDKWYRFFDRQNSNDLQFRNSAPMVHEACKVWLDVSQHPTLQDGIVTGQLCIKDGENDCFQSIPTRIRRCSAYLVYNIATTTPSLPFCFKNIEDVNGEIQPVMGVPFNNHVLTDHAFYIATQVVKSHECLIMCQLQANCQSFNFSQKLKRCELNEARKNTFPEKYIFNDEYDYYEMSKGRVLSNKIEL